MGSDSSKNANAPGTIRSRERKRSGLSNALAGGDCRSGVTNPRSHASGLSYGSVPEHIAPPPAKCAPVPIAANVTLSPTLTWIPDTEVLLIKEWNRERHETAAAGLRGFKQRPNGEGEAGVSPNGASLNTKQSNGVATTAASGRGGEAEQATPGMTSSNSSAASFVPLSCDCVPAATGRSTGLAFRVPTAGTQPALSGSVAAGVTAPSQASSSTPSSPKVPADKQSEPKKPTSTDSSAPSSVVVSALPVGIDYYRALQARWATPESRAMPPAAEVEDLNDSVILDAVSDSNGSVLSPPVPLGYMIDLFVPQWRAEGLFDQAGLNNHGR